MNKIGTCLWFDHQAEEAAAYYASLFKNSKLGEATHYGEAGANESGQKAGTVMTVDLEIEGLQVLALNGGPMCKHTPALSFFVWRNDRAEIDALWKKLSEGGRVRMALDKYPWSECYGWTSDKYGVEWQFMLSKDHKPKIAPAFLFTDALFGKGEEAVRFYMSLFKDSKIEFSSRDETSKTLMHCEFSLDGNRFVLMEGAGKHGHTFSHAFSLVIYCKTQDEVDHFHEKLSKDGMSEPCGWVKDKYGVSWQVTPIILGEMMQDKDPKRSDRVMKAMVTMKKLDIAKLKAAYES